MVLSVLGQNLQSELRHAALVWCGCAASLLSLVCETKADSVNVGALGA